MGRYGEIRRGHPLQARSLTAEAVHAMSLDPHRAPELELVASCYRMLYYLVWDHPDNWQPFSNGPTLRFLFAQMNELAGVYVRGEPLNWWVCKLLEEIIVDNSEANRKLDGAHLAQTVQRLTLDGGARALEGGGWRGRTQYVQLLKAIVEDDIQPLTLRQVQVVEELSRVKELAPQHGSRAEDVLLFFRDDSSGYRFPHVVQLYEEEKQRAVAKGLAVPPDGLPDPSNVDGDLNYHLEPYP